MISYYPALVPVAAPTVALPADTTPSDGPTDPAVPVETTVAPTPIVAETDVAPPTSGAGAPLSILPR